LTCLPDFRLLANNNWVKTTNERTNGLCRVDSEEDLYRLWVEGYQGNATDSLGSHNGYAFSTFDRDNDEAPVSLHQHYLYFFTLFLSPTPFPLSTTTQ
jgi:hypothetical protein